MPAFVQKNDATLNGTGNFASATLAYNSNVTAGNLLLTLISWFNPAATAPNNTTVTVTDSLGNTWKSIPFRDNTTSGERMQLWYCANCLGGANTVTYTFSANHASFCGGAVLEYSGVNALDNFDNESDGSIIQGNGTAVASKLSTTTGVSQAAATHDTTQLVIGYGQSSNYSNWTVSGAWTLRTTATARQMAVADQFSGNGSYFGQFTLNASANWAVGTVTFYQTDSAQLVQEFDHDDGSLTPRTVDTSTYPQPNAAGNLLFLNVVWLGNNVDVTITSITDTQGNVWTLLPRVTINASGPGSLGPTWGQAAYMVGCKAGANSVSVNFSGAGATFIGLSISEWSGVSAFDGFAQAAASGGSVSSPSLVTTGTDLLIGYATTEDGYVTMTQGAGWTPRTANLRSVWLQSKYNQPAGTYSSPVSGNGGINNNSNLWAAGIAAFTNTGGGGGGSGKGAVVVFM